MTWWARWLTWVDSVRASSNGTTRFRHSCSDPRCRLKSVTISNRVQTTEIHCQLCRIWQDRRGETKTTHPFLSILSQATLSQSIAH